ncbi:MAG: pre-toxin TG domain-containing protein, partial [Anaerolineae bacterium]|nr:pre-toxin TG domain-containing protein [Anaerolineae bacterium]
MSSIQNRQDFRKNWGWALSAGIGMLPVIGTAYDIACLAFERDLITGEKLSDAEKLLIMAGLIGGLIGASFLDEAFDLSSELLKNVSRVDDLADAAKGGKAIGHLDEVADAAKGLGHLDEVMEAAKNLDNVDDALDIAKNLDNLDNALDATKNLDE